MSDLDPGFDLSGLHVTIVGINYTPETSGNGPYNAALAQALHQAGAEVRVVTGVPHYPAWKVDAPYRRRLQWRETVEGISVVRVRHWVPRQAGLAGRALMEASFALLAAVHVGRSKRGVVIAVTPSLSALAAAWLGRRRRPMAALVQDLVGNAAEQSGTAGGRAASLIAAVEYWLLRRSSLVGVISPAFGPRLAREGVAVSKIVEVQNFSRVESIDVPKDEARRVLGWPLDRFLVVHTGNVGMKQGLDTVVAAARVAESEATDVEFVLVGDGNQRRRLQADSIGVDSLRFVDPLPDEVFPLALAAADVLLVSERPQVEEMSLPSKLTTYVAVARPILACVPAGGITHRFVTDNGVGYVVAAGDVTALLEGVASLRGGQVDTAALIANCRATHSGLGREAAYARYVAMAARLAGRGGRTGR